MSAAAAGARLAALTRSSTRLADGTCDDGRANTMSHIHRALALAAVAKVARDARLGLEFLGERGQGRALERVHARFLARGARIHHFARRQPVSIVSLGKQEPHYFFFGRNSGSFAQSGLSSIVI